MSIFDSISSVVGDIVDFGLDIYTYEKESDLVAQETGVKQAIAEAEAARASAEIARAQADSDNVFFKNSTIQQVALIGGIAATLISGMFLIFGGGDD